MKIVVAHNMHRAGSSSGDDLVFAKETDLLTKHGHTIIRYSINNDLFDKAHILKKAIYTLGMFFSIKNYLEMNKLLKNEKPDIMHVHTLFPLLSPSVLIAAKMNQVPVVATLHDTRLACPSATSLREGKICSLCTDGKYLRMIKYNCFKKSKVMSTIVSLVFTLHRALNIYDKYINKYICLNDNQIQLIKESGYCEKKIVKKYNFLEAFKSTLNSKAILNGLPGRYVVFYGRIGEEKGIKELIKIWNKIDDIPLVIMGSGPLEEELKAWSSDRSNIYYLGFTQHEECLCIVQHAEFVVFPSIWYEGCSMVVVETESLGKPIVATNLGFANEAIVNGYNGYKIELGDIYGFVNVIRELWQNKELIISMGSNAKADYLNKYLPEDNYEQLVNIYTSILAEGK